MIDPSAGHSEKIILSDRTVDDYHIVRPTLQEIDIVKNHERNSGDTIYKYPTIPGYEGFVPRINGTCGQRFYVAATEGLAKFQMDNLRNRRKRNELRHRGAMQEKLVKGRSLGERLVGVWLFGSINVELFKKIKTKRITAHNKSVQTTVNRSSSRMSGSLARS